MGGFMPPSFSHQSYAARDLGHPSVSWDGEVCYRIPGNYTVGANGF
ncbi:hypothetical protein VIBNIAM115_1910006 [Vibrio nigripulchritudo AM115]|nr:hypothetical protein VIBNIAM115_1910006 [Vibrio nigripulchritudo AM115]